MTALGSERILVTPEEMLDILAYKREVLTQLLLVATILGAFSMSGAVGLLTGPSRDRLHRFLFIMLCIASLAFVFATALDAVLLPAMKRDATVRRPNEFHGILLLGDAVIVSVLIGALALVTAIAGFGFAFSRGTGILVLVAVAVAMLCFLGSAWYLARIIS